MEIFQYTIIKKYKTFDLDYNLTIGTGFRELSLSVTVRLKMSCEKEIVCNIAILLSIISCMYA